ncbi:MAG: hypothetical protein EOP04_08015 [Proteobacteria bacterium]|nr:MAG: hypothetical protein EOP04_08015 [Pseudomonadota bacterium]
MKIFKNTVLIGLGLAFIAILFPAAGMIIDKMNAWKFENYLEDLDFTYDINSSECPNRIKVTISNKHDLTLKKVNFSIGVYERGSSENIANSKEPELNVWSQITSPATSRHACYDWPKVEKAVNSSNIVFNANVTDIEFYLPGEFVPE